MKKFLLLSLVAGATAFGGYQAANANTENDAAVDARQKTMKAYKSHAGVMGKMIKGEVAYDAGAFAKQAAGLVSASDAGFLSHFPKGSSDKNVEDSEASDMIWQKWDDFQSKHTNFKAEVTKLATVSKSGNLNAIKMQFSRVGKSCKSCHMDYRN